MRQLKNITEQISVIEQERDITEEILRKYLPAENKSFLPVLASDFRDSGQKSFSSEREILYQVLFDMKKDIMDLKNAVRNMVGDVARPAAEHKDPFVVPVEPEGVSIPLKYSEPDAKKNRITEPIEEAPYYEDAAHVEISNATLEEVEKDMIAKVLEKNNGKRKAAAAELGISERTLYRKIKEYDLM